MEYLLDIIISKATIRKTIALTEDKDLKNDLIKVGVFLIELDKKITANSGRLTAAELDNLKKQIEIEKLNEQIKELKELL